jgi:multiple sugar transport system substrate-binding protein
MGAKGSLVLLLVGSILLGFLRVGPSALPVPGAQRVVKLNFWNGFTGPDGRVMLRMIREFNEKNRDIDVTMQRMDWGTYYNKLMVAGIDKRGPEMFVIHASTLTRMYRAGFIGDVEDLFQGQNAVPLDDFEPELMRQLRFGGKLIGMPMDVHPQGFYCNAAMLRAAGIVDAEGKARPPQTHDEFMDAARRMKIDSDGDGRPEQWGFSLSMWRNNYMAVVPQFGGRYFDESGKCVLDCKENVAAMAFLVSLYQEHHLIPPPESNLGWTGFRQHKVAMVFDGIYMLGDLLRLGNFEYLAAPMPVVGLMPGTHGDSHVLCLRRDLKAEQKSAASRFMRFISDHGLAWAAAGQVPARRSTRETPEFQAMPVQAAFARQLPYVKFPPRSPGLFELQQQMDFAVEKAVRGRLTPQEALTEARVNFERFMTNAGLPMLMEEEEP